MKKLSRLICIFLAMLMLFSFAACGENPGGEEGTSRDTSSTNSEDESNQDLSYVSELPSSVKFNGETIRIVGLDKAGVDDELKSEKSNTGNNVNDAVYARNLAIEERLGIKFYIEEKADTDLTAVVDTTIKAGGPDAYQICADGTYTAVRPMVKGYFYDLSMVENFDVEKKYWAQGFRDIASYGIENKQYLVTGAPALSLYRYTFVTIFNRDYFEQAGWEDLYDTVNNGDWTLDYQFSLITDVYTELDAKTGISEGDFVGFITGDTVSIDPYLTACGIHIIKKNSSGRWEFDGSTQERFASMVEKVQQIYYESNGAYVFSSATYDNTGLTFIADKFAAEEGAMATVQLYALEQSIGKIDFKYGIVPMPMFDTNQDRYYSYVQDQVTSFGILTCTPESDLPMIGAVLDLFGYESYNRVVPEYYGRSLSYKFLKDEESQEMLDLIYETTEFDFAGAFSTALPSSVRDETRTVIANKRGNIVGSTFRKWTTNLGTERKGGTGIDRSFNNLLDSFDY